MKPSAAVSCSCITSKKHLAVSDIEYELRRVNISRLEEAHTAAKIRQLCAKAGL